MEMLLKIEEREIYPLVEIAKIERTEITGVSGISRCSEVTLN